MFEQLKSFWTKPFWIILVFTILIFSGARYLDNHASIIEEDKNEYIVENINNFSLVGWEPQKNTTITIFKDHVINFSEDKECYYFEIDIGWED